MVSIKIVAAVFLSITPLAAHAATSASASMADKVDALEARFFEHDYPNQTMDERLTRLEKMVFGEDRSGDDRQRLLELEAAVSAESQATAAPAPQEGTESVTTSARNDGQRDSSSSSSSSSCDSEITDSSSYPHITALEHELLGQSYVGDSVSKRLDRLETRAFGKPSGCDDLSTRTDRLEKYVDLHLHRTAFGVNPEFNSDDTTSVTYGQNGTFPASYSSSAAPANAPSHYMPPPAANSSMLEKVTWMEEQVFGQTYGSDHLLQRLRRLDQTLFPSEAAASDMKLMDQVDALISQVEVIQRQRHQSTAPQAIAALPPGQSAAFGYEPETPVVYGYNQPPQYGTGQPQLATAGSYAYNQPLQTSAGAYPINQAQQAPPGAYAYAQNQIPANQKNEQAQQQVTQQPAKRHPFLKEFAHVLGEAGSMALGMTGNSYGGIGMAPGYWY